MRHFLAYILLLVASSLSNLGLAQFYKADLAKANWSAISNPPTCSLSHEIPRFGKAVFTRGETKLTQFHLELQAKALFPAGLVTVTTLPPSWNNQLVPISITELDALAGDQPIKLDAAQTAVVLAHLAAGSNIIFSALPNSALDHASSTAGAGVVRVVLESKNFAAAFKIYQECSGEMVTPRVDAKVLPVKSSQFAANIMQSEWKAQSNPFACSLTHVIPNFGKAVFARKAGVEEEFYLDAQAGIVFPQGTTTIETLPPPWKGDLKSLSLGTIAAAEGNRPIKLQATEVVPLVTQLSLGTRIMFTASSVSSSNQSASSSLSGLLRVVIEPKNFAPAYKLYTQCKTELIPYSFSQVSRLQFNYPEQSEGLAAAIKIELAKVARYMKADTKVLGLLIDAHSDNSGNPEANMALSQQQAEWAQNFLIEQGIVADKIKARWHADTFAIADNKTPAGRAKNRRMTVRMETEETRLEIEKKAIEDKEKEEKIAAEKAAADIAAKEQSSVAPVTNPQPATAQSPAQNAINAAKINSSQGKVTPEDVNKMVEGLDLIKK